MYDDERVNAAEEEEEPEVCQSYRFLGDIHTSEDERDRAIHRFEAALELASRRFNWPNQLFWINHSLVELSLDEGKLSDARTHIEQAKSHAVGCEYNLGRVMAL